MMFLFNNLKFILLLCLFNAISINNLYAKELISSQCEPLVESASALQEVKHSQGMLWEISKPGKEASYLFGTIHVSDEEVTRLPEIVDNALHDSRQFVMEALPDQEQMTLFYKSMFFSDGQLLSTLVDTPIYDKIFLVLS